MQSHDHGVITVSAGVMLPKILLRGDEEKHRKTQKIIHLKIVMGGIFFFFFAVILLPCVYIRNI